jgi:ATP synthase protein I
MADNRPPKRPGPGANEGWAALSTLISGIAVWGAAGALLDWWLGIPKHIGLLVGMIIGIAVALYLVVKKFG